jgi:hypothetical protein
MLSNKESTAGLITFTGVGPSAGSAMCSFEVNLDPESGVSCFLNVDMLKCCLHHDLRSQKRLQTCLVRYIENCPKSSGQQTTQRVLPSIVRPKSKQRGRGSGAPFALSVWRERIHTLLLLGVGWIRSIQTPHISDHLVKLHVVLVNESRFLFQCDVLRTDGRDARRLLGLGGTPLFSSR